MAELAAAARTTQSFVVERYGLVRDVDTTVLAGNLVGLALPLTRGATTLHHIIGVITHMDTTCGDITRGDLILRNGNGRCQLHPFASVMSAMTKPAGKRMTCERDAVLLRYHLDGDGTTYAAPSPNHAVVPLERGRSALSIYLATLQKRDFLSRRRGHCWPGDTTRAELDRAYRNVSIISEHAITIASHDHVIS